MCLSRPTLGKHPCANVRYRDKEILVRNEICKRAQDEEREREIERRVKGRALVYCIVVCVVRYGV